MRRQGGGGGTAGGAVALSAAAEGAIKVNADAAAVGVDETTEDSSRSVLAAVEGAAPDLLARVRRHARRLEAAHVALLVFHAILYVFSMAGEDRDAPARELVVAAYCVMVFALAVLLARFVFPLCRYKTTHRYVDKRLMIAICCDPISILAIAISLGPLVIDLFKPRTPMASATSSVGVIAIITVVFSDAQVNESRRFTLFTVLHAFSFMVFLVLGLLTGLVTDTHLFTIQIWSSDLNATAAVDDGVSGGVGCGGTNANGSVSYSRSQVQRMLVIQLLTLMLPAGLRVCCRKRRSMLFLVEKPVERWEIMDPRTVPFLKRADTRVDMQHLRDRINRAMMQERAAGLFPKRLDSMLRNHPTLRLRGISAASSAGRRHALGISDDRDPGSERGTQLAVVGETKS